MELVHREKYIKGKGGCALQLSYGSESTYDVLYVCKSRVPEMYIHPGYFYYQTCVKFALLFHSWEKA